MAHELSYYKLLKLVYMIFSSRSILVSGHNFKHMIILKPNIVFVLNNSKKSNETIQRRMFKLVCSNVHKVRNIDKKREDSQANSST